MQGPPRLLSEKCCLGELDIYPFTYCTLGTVLRYIVPIHRTNNNPEPPGAHFLHL